MRLIIQVDEYQPGRDVDYGAIPLVPAHVQVDLDRRALRARSHNMRHSKDLRVQGGAVITGAVLLKALDSWRDNCFFPGDAEEYMLAVVGIYVKPVWIVEGSRIDPYVVRKSLEG